MGPINGKQPDMSMQVPLLCPGRKEQERPCGSNLFEMVVVAMYTRHRLKANDRRFDAPAAVGNRFRCIACGHVLDKDDFNGPMDGPKLSL